jgi:hypothetical protein
LKDNVRKSVFLNQEFDEPRDVSDLASAAEIIDLLLASAKNPEVPWESKNAHSRDYVTQLLDALRAKYPELARTGRLRLIPNGEVFLSLDRKARSGKLPDLDELIEITPERKKIVDDAVWEVVRNHRHTQVK